MVYNLVWSGPDVYLKLKWFRIDIHVSCLQSNSVDLKTFGTEFIVASNYQYFRFKGFSH